MSKKILFASPANKQNTGPLPRFARMIRSPNYRLMFNYVAIEYEPIEIEGDQARQRVTLVGPEGLAIVYLFVLSKQAEGSCSGCWLTDAVLIERINRLTIPERSG
jgi:hypothetical protein